MMWWYWMKKEWLFEISPENSEIACQNGVKQFLKSHLISTISNLGFWTNRKLKNKQKINLDDVMILEYLKKEWLFEISPENCKPQWNHLNFECKVDYLSRFTQDSPNEYNYFQSPKIIIFRRFRNLQKKGVLNKHTFQQKHSWKSHWFSPNTQ